MKSFPPAGIGSRPNLAAGWFSFMMQTKRIILAKATMFHISPGNK